MDKAIAEKMVDEYTALVRVYIAETTEPNGDYEDENRARRNMLAYAERLASALTHPPVSRPLPEAKPQGEAAGLFVKMYRQCVCRGKEIVCHKCDRGYNQVFIPADSAVIVHPIEGKGSAGECKHPNMRKLNYTTDRICDDCHKIFSPKIRPFLSDPPCQYCGKNMVYGDHPPYCGTCGRWKPLSRVPPDAPANHILDTNKMADHLPDLTKVIQSDLLDAIDNLEGVIDECSAAHEHGDNTVDALPTLTPLLDVMKYLKSLHIPEDMQSKPADPLYDKSAEFRAGYLWGIGEAADHIVDMRDMMPAPELQKADIEINMPDGVVRVFGYLHQTSDAPEFFDRVAKSVRVMVESGMIRFKSSQPAPEVVEGAPRDAKS